MRRTNLDSNVEVVMLLTLCTNFQVFAHFALQSLLMKLYFWYFSCKHFPEISYQCSLFAPLFLHLKHFEAFALLCVAKGILLDIGLNLRHFLALQSQSSNFLYSVKKSVACVKLFSLKSLHFHWIRHRKRIILFSATHSNFCYSAKIKQGYFAKHQKLFLL